VPRGTSFAAVKFTHQPIPGTGPYRIASATSHEIRYVRNPFFNEWSHAAQPDGNPDVIVMRFGLTPAQEAQAVAKGTADWIADQIPPNQLPQLAARFGNRLHSFSTTETDFYRFNTRRPLFSNVRVRRAVNLALDRRQIARTYGGQLVARPTCQVLPPGLSGYKRYCPYTARPRAGGAWTGPDLKRATDLVAASGTRGRTVSLWGWTDDPTISPAAVREVARTLSALGYRVRTRLVPHSYFDTGTAASASSTLDMLPAGWLDTGASAFFVPFVSCGGSFNRFFCDHQIDALIATARRLEESSRRAAAAAWARVDRATVDEAAWLPLVNPRQLDFVSARVRNFQHHPYWDILVDQLWVT
jgi:peptide/nickel transport system substrate-binding protein